MSGPYALAALAPPDPTREGDDHFIGLNMKLQRWQLPPGFVARAENKRFHNGVAEDRRGVRSPVFANSVGAANFLGSGVYSNPNGREMCLVATTTGVAAFRSGTYGVIIPTQIAPTGKVVFSQQFDKVLLHSSDSTVPVQVWDGISSAGFVTVAPGAALTNGITLIPNPPYSVNFLGRAWFPLPSKPDWIGASDLNDYTVYDSLLHEFRINTGSADAIVGLYPYGAQYSLLVGKGQSWDVLGPIPGDLGDSFLTAILLRLAPSSAPPPRMSALPGPKGVGLKARRAVLAIGPDVHFLSDAGGGGIYRITPASGQLSIDPTPVSDAIAPLVRRINWSAASASSAELDGIFALWAVPLDGATQPNAILVYNTVTQQWMGVDLFYGRGRTGPDGEDLPPLPTALTINNLLGFDFYGRRRVYAIAHAQGLIRLLYEGHEDQFALPTPFGDPSTYPIKSLVETRGYSTLGATGDMKRVLNALQLALETYNPEVTITELVAGVNDETAKETFAPDRTKYDIQGKADYRLDNLYENFLAPKRLDYTIRTGDGFKPGPGALLPVEVAQEHSLRYSLSRRGRYVSYRIATNRGTCALLATVVESQLSAREGRRT